MPVTTRGFPKVDNEEAPFFQVILKVVVVKGWSLSLAHLAGSEYFTPSLLHELQLDELDH